MFKLYCLNSKQEAIKLIKQMNTNLQQSLSKIDSLLKNSKYSSLLTQKAKDSATTITTTTAATTATTVAPEEQKQSLPLPNSQPTHSIRATALHPQATAEAKLPLESAVTTYNYFPVDNPLDSNLPIQTSVSIPSQSKSHSYGLISILSLLLSSVMYCEYSLT